MKPLELSGISPLCPCFMLVSFVNVREAKLLGYIHMYYFRPIKNRKHNRLKHYDYSQNGYYFVTICTQNRMWDFGKIKNGKMVLNGNGGIIIDCWNDLPNHYCNCILDEFVIMPNHVHGIVIIDNRNADVGTGFCGLDVGTGLKPVPTGRNAAPHHSLSEIMRGFKTFSSRKINKINPQIMFRWQRSFYDHIIRNEKSLYFIKKYIRKNPMKWERDRNNLGNLWM